MQPGWGAAPVRPGWGAAPVQPGWQVLNRDQQQMQSIDRLAREGRISPWEAQRLEQQDRRIWRQEQRDAARHGGYLTPGEQRRLNREENRINDQLRRDVWR